METYYRLLVPAVFTALLLTVAHASGVPSIPFVDGIWHGDIEIGPSSSDFEECWARTTLDDGTTFRLAERKDGSWYLQLSNASWRLPHSRRYTMVPRVDFYPLAGLQIVAEAKNQTLLEIADLDHISLLGLIENGHTIALASDGFNEKYDLEGSAKAIERIRNCFSDQLAAET